MKSEMSIYKTRKATKKNYHGFVAVVKVDGGFRVFYDHYELYTWKNQK